MPYVYHASELSICQDSFSVPIPLFPLFNICTADLHSYKYALSLIIFHHHIHKARHFSFSLIWKRFSPNPIWSLLLHHSWEHNGHSWGTTFIYFVHTKQVLINSWFSIILLWSSLYVCLVRLIRFPLCHVGAISFNSTIWMLNKILMINNWIGCAQHI